MKPDMSNIHPLTTPQFINQAEYLQSVLQSMDVAILAKLMMINEKLATTVKKQMSKWHVADGSAAALTFRGDIYSGLSADRWNQADAEFAQTHLLIMSGLYGLLRPFDAINPYRLEMGYKLQLADNLRLDAYWERELTGVLDTNDTYINLTADEYFRVIKNQLVASHVISPKFLTINKTTGQPVFVTVHAKIARGAFANWLIVNKIDDTARLHEFNNLNYRFDPVTSTPTEPVFICQEFGGIGLSVRLK